MRKYSYPDETRIALETLQQPLAVYQLVDGQVKTVLVSDGFCRLFGFDSRDYATDQMDHFMYKDVHPDDQDRVVKAAQRFMEGGGEYDVVFRTKTGADSGYRVIHAHGIHVCPEEGVRLAQVWYMEEGRYVEGDESAGAGLTRLLNSALHEESILQAAHYDDLTGLPNLSYFFKLCEIGKARVFSEGKQGVLLYIDLSGMKYFNHRYGFAEGNNLLKAFSEVLARIFQKDNCCHISADRFAVSTTEDAVEQQVQRLFDEAERMNEGRTLPVLVGIYSIGMEDVPVSTAYDRAKMARDELLNSTRSCFRYYRQEMSCKAQRRQYIQANIDRALSEKWIRVYCQAIVRAVSEKVCDEEALARWDDPAEGFLSPAEFIPYLEETGQIYKLDLYMLEQVLEKIRLQQEIGMPVVPHSINLSRSDFSSCDIVEEIRKRVDASGISRSLITVEITESVIGSNFEYMKKQVERFRELGFPVWMDDFGTGYSSLDVLQSIRFDLIKFDMSFMQKLNEGDNPRLVLTDLIKLATSLGVDTVCEGVETEEQVRFLQGIGCSKLQGFFYGRPMPIEDIITRYQNGLDMGFEDPESSSYYEAVGRVNLYDLGIIANLDEDSFQHAFSTLPMSIIEIRGNTVRYMRSNPSYREFVKRFFDFDIAASPKEFVKYSAAFMDHVIRTCCRQGFRTFYNEKMPDGSVVHSFARRISTNPLTGDTAVAIAVLSISDPDQGESYADIARALAADYYNIYVVDLDTDRFIEYTSPVGGDELAVERHGEDFFTAARRDTMTRIYEADRDLFLNWFTKENVIRELDEQGVFTTTYRLIDTGTPIYVNMKITRMQGTNRIILGVSLIDAQMRQREQMENVLKERDALARVMAISEDYLSLYSVNAEDGRYIEYTATSEYETLGFEKQGADFFLQGVVDGKKTVYPEDLPGYLRDFTKENVLKQIRDTGRFTIHYRLVIQGEPVQVSLKIAPFHVGGELKLLAGVRKWRIRKKE